MVHTARPRKTLRILVLLALAVPIEISSGALIEKNVNFDEALFSLYCLDTYPKKDVNIFIPIMEDMMAGQRGFLRFREFNRELMDLYASQGADRKMDALMEGIFRNRIG